MLPIGMSGCTWSMASGGSSRPFLGVRIMKNSSCLLLRRGVAFGAG